MLNTLIEFLSTYYLWIKSFHVMAVVAWMAGLFYLPRLFVYHVEGYEKQGVTPNSEMDKLFQHQERLLLRAIMNPAMIATWLFGVMLMAIPGVVDWTQAWPWFKALSVLAMTWFHMWCGYRRKDFVYNRNTLSGRRFRMMNELPTAFMIVIVLAVIVKF